MLINHKRKKKKRQCHPIKLNPAGGKGAGGGSENDNCSSIFDFTSYFIYFNVVMFVFMVTECIYESSEKNQTTRIRKNGRLSQSWSMRALCK